MSTTKPKQASTKNYVVFMFADLRDFTSFTRQHGDDAALRLVRRFFSLVRSRAVRCGGSEWKRDGDQILFTFSTVHDAVAAALSVQDGLTAYNQSNPETPLNVGIGLDAGEPISAEGDYIGITVNRTARVTGLAKAGQVFVTESICQFAHNIPSVGFRDRGLHKLKGFEQLQRLYEPIRITSDTQIALGFQRSNKPIPHLRQLGLLAAVASCLVLLASQFGLGHALRYDSGVSANPLTFSKSSDVVPIANSDSIQEIQQIVEDGRRFTVRVAATGGSGTLTGSGIVFDKKGLVATAAHVVAGATNVQVLFDNNRSVSAAVLKRSQEVDVAILQLPQGSYDAAALARSAQLLPGDEVVILGYPGVLALNAQATVTWGLISHTGAGSDGSLLQIAADLNPGDSGGPVFNRQGQVVGMNIGRIETSKGRPVQGIGLALPIQTIISTVTQ